MKLILPPLLLIVACRSDDAPSGVCATGASEGDTAAAPPTPPPGLDLSARITQCPVWSGVPDYFGVSGSFEGVFVSPPNDPYEGNATTQTMAWLHFSGSTNPDTWEGTEYRSSSLTVSREDYDLKTLQSTEWSFICDEEGYRLIEQKTYTGVVQPSGAVEENSAERDYVKFQSEPLLIIPRDLTLGKTWTTRGTGVLVNGNSYGDFDCDYTFEVAEIGNYSVPAGTWEAARIRLLPHPEASWCDVFADLTYFGHADGFWVGKGIGLLSYVEPETYVGEYKMRRTAAQ